MNADTITDDEIRALRDEAEARGDTMMAETCREALEIQVARWRHRARARCAKAIASARAEWERDVREESPIDAWDHLRG